MVYLFWTFSYLLHIFFVINLTNEWRASWASECQQWYFNAKLIEISTNKDPIIWFQLSPALHKKWMFQNNKWKNVTLCTEHWNYYNSPCIIYCTRYVEYTWFFIYKYNIRIRRFDCFIQPSSNLKKLVVCLAVKKIWKLFCKTMIYMNTE